jgi:hypothetical protein
MITCTSEVRMSPSIAVSDVAIVPALDGGWAFGVIVTGMRVTKYRISTDIRREFFKYCFPK